MAPQIVTAGASYAVAALAGIVGIIGMYLTVKDATENEVAIPLGTNSRNVVPTPAASATTDTTQKTTYIGGLRNDWPTVNDACAAAYAEQIKSPLDANYEYAGIVDYTTCRYKIKYTPNDAYSTYSNLTVGQTTTAICPSGYVMDAGVCKLSNPRKVTDDKRCDLLLQNGQFSTADDLNCSDTADGSKAAPLIRNGKAIVIGQNSNGQPLIVTVSPAETIGDREWVTVKIEEQVQTATETQVKTTTATIDSQTSTVTGVQTQTKPGSIVMPSGSTLPTTSPTTDVTTTPTTQTGTQTQGDITVNTCGLPGQAACAVDDTGFTAQPRPWEGVDKTDDFNKKKDLIDNLEGPELSWQDFIPSFFPGAPTQCHPIDIRFAIDKGPNAGLDASEPLNLCPFFEFIRMFIGFMFAVGSIMYCWRRVTNAKGQSYGT